MRGAVWALGLGVVIASAVGLAGLAQTSSDNQASPDAGSSSSSDGPPGVPTIAPPPEPTPPPATSQDTREDHAPSNSAPAKPAPPKPPPPPPPPPPPVRSPAAVFQALDKVTTETMRFAVPVGKPIRFKNLVFVVKACESTGLGGASPQASAYVVIDSAPLNSGDGAPPPPPREVFKGWMFANSPGLNPFQHPVYDAWLISCMAATPPA